MMFKINDNVFHECDIIHHNLCRALWSKSNLTYFMVFCIRSAQIADDKKCKKLLLYNPLMRNWIPCDINCKASSSRLTNHLRYINIFFRMCIQPVCCLISNACIGTHPKQRMYTLSRYVVYILIIRSKQRKTNAHLKRKAYRDFESIRVI